MSEINVLSGSGLKSIETSLPTLSKIPIEAFDKKCVSVHFCLNLNLVYCCILLIYVHNKVNLLIFLSRFPFRLFNCKDVDHVFDTTIGRIKLCWVNINIVCYLFELCCFFLLLYVVLWILGGGLLYFIVIIW